MRGIVDRATLERFLAELGRRARGPGRVYLTGGATALLYGWRPATVDVDLKLDPEPAGAFEAIAGLKEELDLNVELASPDQFLPRSRAGASARSSSRATAASTSSTSTRSARRSPSWRAPTSATSATSPPCWNAACSRARTWLGRSTRSRATSSATRASTRLRSASACGASSSSAVVDLDGLPGEALVRRGLEDLARGARSAEALTVALATGRLRRCGLALPEESALPDDRELALYALLVARGEGDAYARYNALRRELDSFLEALEARLRRAQDPAARSSSRPANTV